ncbi:hypothetical protein FQ188_24410, partial [Rhodococcus sp. ANT_H53B]
PKIAVYSGVKLAMSTQLAHRVLALIGDPSRHGAFDHSSNLIKALENLCGKIMVSLLRRAELFRVTPHGVFIFLLNFYVWNFPHGHMVSLRHTWKGIMSMNDRVSTNGLV